MISSTVATLECAAQVSTAAITTHSSGSPVMAPSSVRTAGACSAGRERVEQDMQREQHQAEADRDAAECP